MHRPPHHHLGRPNGLHPHLSSNQPSSSHLNSNLHPGQDQSSGLDKVASASTALDRVMGLLDGFEDDMDCPLCLEEMDISDLNFKPCPCGYQICRFCWHHIKENLNGRCPACRATYDDTTVEFKAIKPDELKRLQAAKKVRDKRRKDDALTVKNMANVRVRQRAQVHIQGMTTKIANEDTLNQLKGPEQFGQYGKVVKLFMSKRSSTITQPASTHPHYQPVNVYVNYRTPAEASNCISAMDGSTTSDGHKLKAIWGTTRYCPTYLKGGKCNNENCMQAHEPGEEIEGAGPVSREEIYTYHAMSDSEIQRTKASNAVTQIRKQQEATLPPTASWASKNPIPMSQPTTPIVYPASLPPLSASIKPPPAPHPVRPIAVSKPQNHPLPPRPSSRPKTDAQTPTLTSLPARPAPPTPSTSDTPAPSVAELPRKPSPTHIPTPPEEPTPVASSSQPPSPTHPTPLVEAPLTNGLSNGAYIPRPPSVPPFPELEFGDGSFSFSLNLDVKGKGRAVPAAAAANDERSARDFANLDGFGRNEHDQVSPAMSNAPSYIGSFDPFADGSTFDTGSDPHSESSSPPLTADDASRRSSRFGFARRGSQGVKSGDLASALARSAFASGRESPTMFAPPGMPHPQHRPPSSIGFNALPSPSANGDRKNEPSALWPGVNLGGGSGSYNGALPPNLLRSLASPGPSTSSSPQLSPRTRAGMGGYGATPPGPPTSLPPGISLNRTPIPAASFPLPPPAPRPSGQSNPVGKDDIFALIAAAQASAPKAQHNQAENHPFFSDPAILNARLASTNSSGPHYPNAPQSAAYHSLETGMPPQMGYNVTRGFAPEQQQQQQFGFGPPPGVGRQPQMGYQQQSLFGRK